MAVEELNRYTETLKADFPNLPIEKVDFIGQGWDHVAVEVNGSIIFRLPRGVYNQEHLQKSVRYETQILKHLRGKLPVAIPDPQFIAPGEKYFGYPKLPGKLLNEILSDFTPQDIMQAQKDWVAIAVGIHQGVPLELARGLEIPEFDSQWFIDNAKKLFSLPDIKQPILDFAKRVITRAEAIDTSKHLSFIHNDLHFLNLLANPATKRITGLIDWTALTIGPLEKEFSIWEWGHDNQLADVAGLYEVRTSIKIDQRAAKTWRHLEELSDWVEQLEKNESSGAFDSLDHIQRWIEEEN